MIFSVWQLCSSNCYIFLKDSFDILLIALAWCSDLMVWSVRFGGFPGLFICTIELFCKLCLQNKSAFLCGVMKTYRQREKQGSKVQESTKGPDEAKIKVTFRKYWLFCTTDINCMQTEVILDVLKKHQYYLDKYIYTWL